MILQNSKFPKVLYHYCSMETFYSIIANKNIWFSPSINTNDAKEIILTREIISKNYSKLEACISKNDLDIILKELDRYVEYVHPYIFCMTEKEDLLSQWITYANDGKGVAIGFDMDYLDLRQGVPFSDCNLSNRISLGKVKYSNENELLNEIKRLLCVDDSKKEIENYKEEELKIMIAEIFILSSCFKDKSFKQESEWRIIYMPLPYIKAEALYKNFRVASDKIYPYYKYELFKGEDKTTSENCSKSPIAELVCGPCNKSLEKNLKEFLSVNGFGDNVKISRSGSSYIGRR